MRLGQLARKYDVSIEEIITYIKEIGAYQHELKPNSKLEEKTKDLVAEHFDHLLEPSSENMEEPSDKLEKPSNELIEDTGESTEVPQDVQDILLPESEYQEMALPLRENKSIETDRLLELLESDEQEVDLSKITLIKAPKKELSGLKVLGKIELEEPKTKITAKTEEQEKEPRPDRKTKHQHQQLSAEEQEEKRLKFKKRREEYDALQEKLQKEKQQKQRKAFNKARYEQKVKGAKSNQQKKKDEIPRQEETPVVKKEQRPIPKTVFGKFWRWLDASS